MVREERKREISEERARRALERKERNLAALGRRQVNRTENKRNQLEGSKLRSTKAVLKTHGAASVNATPAAAKPSASNDLLKEALQESVAPVEISEGSIADHMASYLEEYLRAEEVLRKATEQLVSIRGSEAALNDEDRDVLENLRDILAAQRSKYLEL